MSRPPSYHTDSENPTIQPAPITESPPGAIRRWLRGHLRALQESLAAPKSSPFSTSMTVVTLAISFFLPLMLWSLWINVENIKKAWQHQGSIAVFLKPGVSAQQAGLLMQQLKEEPVIESTLFITPEEIRQQLQQDPQLHQALQLITTGDLPIQLLLKPAKNATSSQIEQLIANHRLNPKVEYISYDPTWLRQLEAASLTLKALAVTSGMLFLVIVIVILGHSVGHHVARHHEELHLLQLMGAPAAQIRRRFLYGGVLHGLLAALLAWLGLQLVLWSLQGAVQQLSSSYGHPTHLSGPSFSQTLGFVALALAISWLATRLALHNQIRENS